MLEPDARRLRHAVLMVVAGTIAGAILIALLQRYQENLAAWVRQDLEPRVRLVAVAMTIVLSGPPLAIAVYLWRQDDGERPRMNRVVAVVVAAAGAAASALLWRVVFALLAGRARRL
jgi:hypothetical protein